MLHKNNGDCPHCDTLFDKFTGFHSGLRSLFKSFQKEHPEAHVSCAGRGHFEQQRCFMNKVSDAKWGQSAHNFNAAIDLFESSGDRDNLYEAVWFSKVVRPWIAQYSEFEWYGSPGSSYFELPHIQVRNWKDLVRSGLLTPVENVPVYPLPI